MFFYTISTLGLLIIDAFTERARFSRMTTYLPRHLFLAFSKWSLSEDWIYRSFLLNFKDKGREMRKMIIVF